METASVSTFTELLFNIFLGCFSLICLTMAISFIQRIIYDFTDEKRRKKKEHQAEEDPQEPMEDLK